MSRNDVDAVLSLEQELFPEDPWTLETFLRELSQAPGSRDYLVAEDTNGVLVGYAGVCFSPEIGTDGTADGLTMGIRKDWWGRGVGSSLLDTHIAEARRRGYGAYLLEVREDNHRARALYRKLGFVDIGVRKAYYQPSGANAIVMRMELG